MNDIYSPIPVNPSEEVLPIADLLLGVGCPIEVRVKTDKGIKTGYFDNSASLTSCILPYLPNTDVEAIWVLLNPAPANRLLLPKNTILPVSGTTKDEDVP